MACLGSLRPWKRSCALADHVFSGLRMRLADARPTNGSCQPRDQMPHASRSARRPIEQVGSDLTDRIALGSTARHHDPGQALPTPVLDVLDPFKQSIPDALDNGTVDMRSCVHVTESDHRSPSLRHLQAGTPVRLKHEALGSRRDILKVLIKNGFRRNAAFFRFQSLTLCKLLLEPAHHPITAEDLDLGIEASLDADRIGRHERDEAVDILQRTDAVVERVMRTAGWHTKVWQSFAVLPGIRTVDVKGDESTYVHMVALRVVEISDSMTADWVRLPADVLKEISHAITSELPEVNRVVYDITSKPPLTIEWE